MSNEAISISNRLADKASARLTLDLYFTLLPRGCDFEVPLSLGAPREVYWTYISKAQQRESGTSGPQTVGEVRNVDLRLPVTPGGLLSLPAGRTEECFLLQQ